MSCVACRYQALLGPLLDVNNEAQVTVAFPANGKYTLEADVTVPRHSSADKPGAPAHGYGVFRYSARVNVSAQPKVEYSATRVELSWKGTEGYPCHRLPIPLRQSLRYLR